MIDFQADFLDWHWGTDARSDHKTHPSSTLCIQGDCLFEHCRLTISCKAEFQFIGVAVISIATASYMVVCTQPMRTNNPAVWTVTCLWAVERILCLCKWMFLVWTMKKGITFRVAERRVEVKRRMSMGGIGSKALWVCPGIGRQKSCHGYLWKRRQRERRDDGPQKYLVVHCQQMIVFFCIYLDIIQQLNIVAIYIFFRFFLIPKIKNAVNVNIFRHREKNIFGILFYMSGLRCCWHSLHCRIQAR